MGDRYAMCPQCGRRLRRKKDFWGDWDGETYICEHCASEDDDNDFEDDDDDDDPLSVYDAALIWASHGKDEDYMFGYTEEELEDAL